ncbi:hypothetical protein SALB1_1971 [Salinisphaera sp. LB1]|nr:hypothetical protein SALB1_1971 [Salinisphaera sp. LB1]
MTHHVPSRAPGSKQQAGVRLAQQAGVLTQLFYRCLSRSDSR